MNRREFLLSTVALAAVVPEMWHGFRIYGRNPVMLSVEMLREAQRVLSANAQKPILIDGLPYYLF